MNNNLYQLTLTTTRNNRDDTVSIDFNAAFTQSNDKFTGTINLTNKEYLEAFQKGTVEDVYAGINAKVVEIILNDFKVAVDTDKTSIANTETTEKAAE